jgi:hypothetical protein
MNFFASPNLRLAGFYLLLIVFCSSPIWAVEYFINQDGSAHLYSAFLMLELIKGNPAFGEIYAFNSISVPNSSGHWLMAFLLPFFSPFIITKIIVTLTFAGLVATVGWLRLKTVGTEGLKTSLLFGAAIGFNWLWFVGFYNFLIGVGCFVFTLGLFFNWRDKMNLPRAVALALLFLLAYLSHIVSFAILAGSVLVLCFSASRENIKRDLLWLSAALLPVIPLILIYKSVSASGGGFFPVWRNLENPLSIANWLAQIRTADPFIIMSRKSFPFLTDNSSFFAVLSPILWILGALAALAAGTFLENKGSNKFSKNTLVFVFLFVACTLTAIFAPDDFGLNNGSILRERLFLCGLIFFIPVFRVNNCPKLKRLAQICLFFVVVFQTAAVWEYARQTDRKAREFFAVQNKISADERIASVIVFDDDVRFHSIPMTMINNYTGIGTNRTVWDNYEIGHYLFPVVAKNEADKKFVFNLTRYNSFSTNHPNDIFEDRLANFEKCLFENHQKINILLVWDKEPRVDAILNRWFAEDVLDTGGRVRIFRHR